jgi:hypothetical protein
VRLDRKDNRTVSFDPGKMQHFDHGYAVTSHVSQGLTEGRVIANIDTDSSRSLINTPENDSNGILTEVIGLTCSGQTGRIHDVWGLAEEL